MIFLLTCILLSATFTGVLGIWILSDQWDSFGMKVLYGIWTGFLGALPAFLLVFPLAGFTGGADPDYGKGTATGIVIQSEKHGVIYKTCEVNLQQGLGEYRTVLALSGQCLDDFLGKRIVVSYQEYFLADYKQGFSRRYISEVSLVD